MKSKFFYFLVLFNCGLFAQTPDPYKFFPSAVGNVWEYNTPFGNTIIEIQSVSIDSLNSKWIFYTGGAPSYKIDTLYQVYKYPFDLNWLYYKLNADTGDNWIVDVHHIVDTFFVYKLAKVRSIYEGFFYDRSTTFKEITFYQYQPDSILNEFSWPEYTETVAYGIGLVSVFDDEGGGPQRILQGCIIDGDTIGIITSVKDEFNVLNSFELFQNYPNPFNPTTTIKFNLAEPQKVKLTVYSLLGEEVEVLMDEYKSAGTHSVVFNAYDLPSGVYIYTIVAGNRTSSKKLILLK